MRIFEIEITRETDVRRPVLEAQVPIRELDRVRMIVSKGKFPVGTTGTIVMDYGDGIGFQIEITKPSAGLMVVRRDEIEQAS